MEVLWRRGGGEHLVVIGMDFIGIGIDVDIGI